MYLVKNKLAIEHCLSIAKNGYSQTCFIVDTEMEYSFTINYYDKDHPDNPNMFDIQLKICRSK
ncbi:hypothetical protein DDR33_24010 [Pararcticibacter amylolyticus]|uniref:Uncharacterized protein n=1 Tax=Pararcticibacter amylolyticus TaxID=2173175 RepID=A0A2U2P9R3_9SPHI|nr:hypothetical protein DDR33_24010 [Pararcticibacter amylolyticus]